MSETCLHGHQTRTVGCASCVLLSGRSTPPHPAPTLQTLTDAQWAGWCGENGRTHACPACGADVPFHAHPRHRDWHQQLDACLLTR